MAKFDTSFNFGANVASKPKAAKGGGKGKAGGSKTGGKKSDAWKAYTGGK